MCLVNVRGEFSEKRDKELRKSNDPYSRKQMSLFSVLPSECRPPGVTVKLLVIQEGGLRSESYGRRIITWSRDGDILRRL